VLNVTSRSGDVTARDEGFCDSHSDTEYAINVGIHSEQVLHSSAHR